MYSVHIRTTVFELYVMKEERKKERRKKDKKLKLSCLFFSAFVSGSKTHGTFIKIVYIAMDFCLCFVSFCTVVNVITELLPHLKFRWPF